MTEFEISSSQQRCRQILLAPRAIIDFKDIGRPESYKHWVKEIKNAKLPPLTKSASEVSPDFFPVAITIDTPA